MSVWDLIEIGDFEGACRAADEESTRSPSMLPLRNKIFALLSLKRYQDAVELSRQIIEKTTGRSDSDFIFLGVSQWLLGDRNGAVESWESATGTEFTDAAGGVEVPLLLFFASTFMDRRELSNRAILRLRQLCKRARSSSWPGPLASFIVGKTGEAELLSALDSEPSLHSKQFCQAAFYMAVLRKLSGDLDGYDKLMKNSCSQGAVTRSVQEYFLADWAQSQSRG